MLFYQGGYNTNHRQVSSAQTNRTPSANMRETLGTTLSHVDIWACSWLGWIALETSFWKAQDH